MKIQKVLPLATCMLLAACTKTGAPETTATTAAPTEKPVAVVNGVNITREQFDSFAKSVANKPSAELTPEQRTQLLDSLVNAQVLAQQASKDGVDKAPETDTMLQLSRMQILAQADAEHYMKDKTPTDAEIKAEYDTQIAAMPKTQYHARHILVASQEAAQQIIQQLHKGAKFEDLARKNSTDSSKNQGGDLNWFAPNAMVKPVADAVVALKKGEITQTPVQSQYGWHVIQLLDTRDAPIPPFDDRTKEQLSRVVKNKKFRAYLDGLVKTAKVEKNL